MNRNGAARARLSPWIWFALNGHRSLLLMELPSLRSRQIKSSTRRPTSCASSLQPHLSLLQLDYAVDDFVIALKQRATDGLRGEASNAFDSAPKAVRRKQRLRLPVRSRVFLAVHRYENRLYFKRLEAEAFALLTALGRGVTLADACIEAISSSGKNEVNWPPKIQAWFQNWAALGWLCRAK